MTSSKRGSIFLITLTMLTVVFVLGFAFTFFTGSEDYSSSMSYESEVAFNLAESAIEEFVARLKNSLNHNDSNNQLYKVLRSHNLDVSKDIPLDANQVANLTAFTRDLARQVYGIQFGRGLTDSKDFVVDAVLKLQHVNAVEASSGETVLYKIKQDTKEKQGELNVTATVVYKGHEAKVSLKFLIRVVKTFIPPFNYFTLYIRDASVAGGSSFNTYNSSIKQYISFRLDNGWNALTSNFDATKDRDFWENELSLLGEKAAVPPGRVYLGQDLNTLLQTGPGIVIRSTNGAKLLFEDDHDPNKTINNQMNGQENGYLRFDVPWTGLKDYVKKYMELQGQEKTKDGILWFTGWNNKIKIRLFNIGSGEELLAKGGPSFINCFKSYSAHTQNMVEQTTDDTEKLMMKRFVPELSYSGFHPFGAAPPIGNNLDPNGSADFTKLSPTLVYGPVMRQYFRAVQLQTKAGEKLELPYVNEKYFGMITDKNGNPIKESKEMDASQARMLFSLAGVPPTHIEKLISNWDDFPDGLHEYEKYKNFMSDSGAELYNKGLANILNRIDKKLEYDGKLSNKSVNFLGGYLESYPYPYDQIPKGMESVIGQCPVREFYEGPLAYAMPDAYSSYLLDFYFIPRCTEDFFRGRMTVAIGGVSYDRFEYKYINNVQAYKSGAKNQTLELNGILALNDSEPLGLNNLKFQGHGIIYSSPMMGGGKVVIAGDLLGVDTDETKLSTSIGSNFLTIVAPQIVINTDYAQGDRCYVEANLMSISEPLIVTGEKPITIKGTVVTPYLNMAEHLPPNINVSDIFDENQKKEQQNKLNQILSRYKYDYENVIIYNPLNGIWRNKMPDLMDSMYVAKIVTGGVGKFEWKYEK